MNFLFNFVVSQIAQEHWVWFLLLQFCFQLKLNTCTHLPWKEFYFIYNLIKSWKCKFLTITLSWGFNSVTLNFTVFNWFMQYKRQISIIAISYFEGLEVFFFTFCAIFHFLNLYSYQLSEKKRVLSMEAGIFDVIGWQPALFRWILAHFFLRSSIDYIQAVLETNSEFTVQVTQATVLFFIILLLKFQ